MREELKKQIKDIIERKLMCSGIITDVVVVPVTQAGKRKIMIGIETITCNQSSEYYDIDDYPTEEDLVNAIIINNLEELSTSIWESAKQKYYE